MGAKQAVASVASKSIKGAFQANLNPEPETVGLGSEAQGWSFGALGKGYSIMVEGMGFGV